ncbi:MAG: hypothetical protein ACE5EK_11665, partial [Nitrospinales bacterium]
LYKEKVYQEKWCGQAGGTLEVTLKADSIKKSKWLTGLAKSAPQSRFRYSGRVDCLTAHYAIEFDFADKWAEAIGQALFYEMLTGKKAGIVLILEKEKDLRYLAQLNDIIQQFNLKIVTWAMKPEDL